MKRRLRPHIERVIQNEIDKAARDQDARAERCQIGIRNQSTLLALDIGRILTGAVEIIDDRTR